MKKKIFLRIILIVEACLYLLYLVGFFVPAIKDIFIVNYLFIGETWLLDKCKFLMDLSHLSNFIKYDELTKVVGLIIVELLFILVYYLIFGILTTVIRKKNTKKRRELVSKYELTPSEQNRFSVKKYLKKFTFGMGISFIIPLIVAALFVLIRFDQEVCNSISSPLNGLFNIYTTYLKDGINSYFGSSVCHDFFVNLLSNTSNHGYINLIYSFLPSSLAWVEYIIDGVLIVVLFLVWLLIIWLIHLIFKKAIAKHKCKLARRKYIEKMEKIDYKTRKAHKEEINTKGDEFINVLEKEHQVADSSTIANINVNKQVTSTKEVEQRKKAYYEELGFGVVDLGVSNESSSDSKPLQEREVKYISDDDIDIILEEEPVIEVVQEDDSSLKNDKQNDVFFEPYQNDDAKVEIKEQKLPDDVNKYVSKVFAAYQEETSSQQKDVIKEEVTPEPKPKEKETVLPKETKQEEKEAVLPKETKQEANQEKEIPQENQKEEDIKPEETKAPTKPAKYDPFAAYRNKNYNKGTKVKKVPSFKEMKEQNNNEE